MDNVNHKPSRRWMRIVSLAVVLCIIVSITLVTNHRLLDNRMQATENTQATDTVVTEMPDGAAVINTSSLAKEVEGYAGAVPLSITVRNGIIDEVKALPNDETPSFFNEAFAALAPQWKGKKVADAIALNVDAYSGATFSSEAIIINVQRGLRYYNEKYAAAEKQEAADAAADAATKSNPISDPAWWAAIVVALAAAVLPFCIKGKWYRPVQLAANVAVLGFWTGTFISYTVLGSIVSNSFSLAMLPVWLLVAIAFIMPLAGKGNHYCAWTCPLGSLQQLAGMPLRGRVRLSLRVQKALAAVRRIVWGVLVFLVLSGIFTDWMNYEIFTAFMPSVCSTVVICVAAVFVALSFIINRPFCRTLCPVGELIDLTNRTE